MKILRFPTPLLKSNMYLLVEDQRGIIIDPYDCQEFSEEIARQCSQVDYILLTHEHYDHISGTNALRERYGCPVLCSESCGKRIQNSSQNFSRYFEAYATVQTGEPVPEELLPVEEYFSSADEVFSGSRMLLWQSHRLELTETPGHSPGSICILADGKILFSGDTLLPGNVTVTRFPGGSARRYSQIALPYLLKLPLDTRVYPGHYDSFTLKNHSEIERSMVKTENL